MTEILVQEPGSALPTPSKESNYPVLVLAYDSWDDYGYRTMCRAYLHKSPGEAVILLGEVRVMRRGQTSHWKTQESPEWTFKNGPFRFPDLGNAEAEYCSLALSNAFYEKIHAELGTDAPYLLRAIADAATQPRKWSDFEDDSCFQTALLRDPGGAAEVRDKARSLFGVTGSLVNQFEYRVRLPGAVNEHAIKFDFGEAGEKLSTLNLIAGRNGSGKTQLLSKLAIELTGITASLTQLSDTRDRSVEQRKDLAKREEAGRVFPAPSFYAVIAISFNPFDQFERPHVVNQDIRYTYCGIRKSDNTIYTESELVEKLRELIGDMTEAQKKLLGAAAQNTLGVSDFEKYFEPESTSGYGHLSAGQKIVLNILAHLVRYLRKRTLVLMDEPETHLHPSLMAALTTELLRILPSHDSYAVVATHSPIIAQQVQSRHVNIIRRNANEEISVEKPDFETFGENISNITGALFDTREYERDYTAIIKDLLAEHDNDPAKVEQLFPKGLGSNAKVYLWSLAKLKLS
ncbi:AAA family ATPase [Falsiroseomonas sp. E2-1-a4]|uniref:AAA family ATPase n=1 Tax=Falsiroseomonas sp. E2-1-a4 TaxID=3239299 RepID=UPI003F3B175D